MLSNIQLVDAVGSNKSISFSAGLIHWLQYFAKSSQIYLDYCMLIGEATRTVQNESTTSIVFLLPFTTHFHLGTYPPVSSNHADFQG